MYIEYLSSPISEGFETRELQSTRMEEIDDYDLENDAHWSELRVNDRTNHSFEPSFMLDSRHPVEFSTNMTRNYRHDFQPTPTLSTHRPITTQTSNAPRTLDRDSFSPIGFKPENIHGIRLCPVSNLRLLSLFFFKHTSNFFSSGYVQRYL